MLLLAVIVLSAISYGVFRAWPQAERLNPKEVNPEAILSSLCSVDLTGLQNSLRWLAECPFPASVQQRDRHRVERRLVKEHLRSILRNACYVQQVGLSGNGVTFDELLRGGEHCFILARRLKFVIFALECSPVLGSMVFCRRRNPILHDLSQELIDGYEDSVRGILAWGKVQGELYFSNLESVLLGGSFEEALASKIVPFPPQSA
jgi:hypothetical protein